MGLPSKEKIPVNISNAGVVDKDVLGINTKIPAGKSVVGVVSRDSLALLQEQIRQDSDLSFTEIANRGIGEIGGGATNKVTITLPVPLTSTDYFPQVTLQDDGNLSATMMSGNFGSLVVDEITPTSFRVQSISSTGGFAMPESGGSFFFYWSAQGGSPSA